MKLYDISRVTLLIAIIAKYTDSTYSGKNQI